MVDTKNEQEKDKKDPLAYGKLNKLTNHTNLPTLDVNNSDISSTIKKTIEKAYTNSNISPGPYVGVVLRVDKTPDTISAFGVALNYGTKAWTVKVRIPEIHAYLPQPKTYWKDDFELTKENEEDYDIIESHPSFTPISEEAFKTIPEVGNLVKVDIQTDKGFFLSLLKDSDGNVQDIELSDMKKMSAKKTHKTKKGGSGAPNNKKTKAAVGNNIKTEATNTKASADENKIWTKYSNSTNPLGINIITSTVNGQKITLTPSTMTKYENLVRLWDETTKIISDKDIGVMTPLKYSYGEAFRVWQKTQDNKSPGGKFRSGLQYSVHNYGNAVDVRFNKEFQYGGKYRKYIKNYVDLFISLAQKCGFVRFGIGYTFIHIDTGEGASQRPPGWWVYHPKATTAVKSKKLYYKQYMISSAWLDKTSSISSPPPELTNFDYMSVKYKG